jgi:hypothetical protein
MELINLGSAIAEKWNLRPDIMGAIGLALIPLEREARVVVLKRLLTQSFYTPDDMKTEFPSADQTRADRNFLIWMLSEITDLEKSELVAPFKTLVAELDYKDQRMLWYAFVNHFYVRYKAFGDILPWHARLILLGPKILVPERLIIMLLGLRGMHPRRFGGDVVKSTEMLMFVFDHAWESKTPQEFSAFMTAPRYLELKALEIARREEKSRQRDGSPNRTKLPVVTE